MLPCVHSRSLEEVQAGEVLATEGTGLS
ncbi:MAG: nitrogen fixation protein NifQ, partial [Mesorhizobium sp.]